MNDLFLQTSQGRILSERVDTQCICELMLRDVLESDDKEKVLFDFVVACQDIKVLLDSRNSVVEG